jgi:predicted phosphodiesterase
VRRGLVFVLVGLLGALAGILSLSLDSRASGSVGPGQVTVRAHWGHARTELQLPPFGQISAATHRAPVTLEAVVDRVDLDQLQTVLASDAPGDRLHNQVSDDLGPVLRRFAIRALLVAAAAGAVARALVSRRPWSHALTGMIGGLTAVAVLLGGAWQGFDDDAFKEARFEGPIERAPALLATMRRHVDGFADVRKRVEVLGDQVAELYSVASAGALPGTAEDEVAILHVSDIHSNPVGLEVTRQLAERFKVDAVLDTGDLTSFGLPIEGHLGELVAKVPAPYLFVPGNHDSAANRAALDAVPNVELLDGKVRTVRGVRILGVADPTFTATNEIDSAEARTTKAAAAPRVGSLVDAEQPDILAVHDAVLGADSWGRVPLILAGHTHKRSTTMRDGTRIMSIGSTGSTGLGSFKVETSRSYDAQVLRFIGGKLAAVDRVDLRGVGGAFRVERELIVPSEEPLLAESHPTPLTTVPSRVPAAATTTGAPSGR